MIRVKVLKARDILFKFLASICIVISLYVFFIFFLRSIYISSRKFSFEIVEENIGSIEVKSSTDFNINLVQSELGIKVKKDDNDIIIALDERRGDWSNTESEKTNIDFDYSNNESNSFISHDIVEHTSRPAKYEVKKLPSGKVQVGNSYINNYSGIELNLDELSNVSDFAIDNSTNILIFHTHTSEAYEEIGTESNFRSTDDAYNVVSVGETLKENLLLKNFHVLHDITKHDTPSYNGAYGASLTTVERLFKEKKYDIVIDLHRDALSGNIHFRPTTQINGETVAKVMFVVGSNGSGLEHPNWMNNLKLALLIQNTAEEMYPGLFRDLNLAKYRYNQHVSDGALILEVGCTGNTLTDTKNAMKYLSNVLASLKENN